MQELISSLSSDVEYTHYKIADETVEIYVRSKLKTGVSQKLG